MEASLSYAPSQEQICQKLKEKVEQLSCCSQDSVTRKKRLRICGKGVHTMQTQLLIPGIFVKSPMKRIQKNQYFHLHFIMGNNKRK